MEGKTETGYQKLFLKPYVPDGLMSVSATQETMSGTIKSSWINADQSFVYDVSIPANTQGTVVLPDFGLSDIEILESGQVIWKENKPALDVSGIINIKRDTSRNNFV